MYLPSDPRLEWPGEGPLFEFNLNNAGAKMWALFKSPLGHYVRPAALGQIRHQCKSLSDVAEYV